MTDSDDALKRAYAAARRERQRRLETPPPDPDALAKALDGTAPEEERIAALEQALAAGAGDELALLQAAGAGMPARSSMREWSRWRWPAATAAAAVLVVAVGLTRGSGPMAGGASENDAAPVFREGERTDGLTILSPVGTLATASALEVTWRAVPGAVRYDVELLTDAGAVLARFTTRDTVFRMNGRVAPASANEATGWWVVATRPDGQVRRSDLRLFRRSPK